jgi:hypothetical protein
LDKRRRDKSEERDKRGKRDKRDKRVIRERGAPERRARASPWSIRARGGPSRGGPSRGGPSRGGLLEEAS